MGKISQLMEDMRAEHNSKSEFAHEIIYYCKQGKISFIRGYDIHIYINDFSLSRLVASYDNPTGMQLHCTKLMNADMLERYGHPPYVPTKINTDILIDTYGYEYNIPLEELIKHGAKEIKDHEAD